MVTVEEHNKLVEEIPEVQTLPLEQRLALAQRRRRQQISSYLRTSETIKDKPSRCPRRNVAFPNQIRLFDACKRNDVEEVRHILKTAKDCNVNAFNIDGSSILHQCSSYGFDEMVEMLVGEFKVEVNNQDAELWTPLHIAALCGRARISQILINGGADLMSMTNEGNMPYDVCEDEDTLDVIETEMANKGISQEDIDTLRESTELLMLQDLTQLFNSKHDLEFRGQHGEAPMHIAACNGYLKVLKFLVNKAKLSLDVIDEDGWQPIHCAAHWKQLPALEFLVRNGADLTSQTFEGQTPADLLVDETLRDWLVKIERNEEETEEGQKTSSYAELPQIYSSYSRINVSSHSINGSMYSSNLSLAEKNSLSSSARKLNTKEREEMVRQTTRHEALQGLEMIEGDEIEYVPFIEPCIDERQKSGYLSGTREDKLTAYKENQSETKNIKKSKSSKKSDVTEEQIDDKFENPAEIKKAKRPKESEKDRSSIKNKSNKTVEPEDQSKSNKHQTNNNNNDKLNEDFNTESSNCNSKEISDQNATQSESEKVVKTQNSTKNTKRSNHNGDLSAHQIALTKTSGFGNSTDGVIQAKKTEVNSKNYFNENGPNWQSVPKSKKYNLFHRDCCRMS